MKNSNEVEIFKVVFKLVHGGYSKEYLDQTRIDMYKLRGREIIFKELHETINLRKSYDYMIDNHKEELN